MIDDLKELAIGALFGIVCALVVTPFIVGCITIWLSLGPK